MDLMTCCMWSMYVFLLRPMLIQKKVYSYNLKFVTVTFIIKVKNMYGNKIQKFKAKNIVAKRTNEVLCLFWCQEYKYDLLDSSQNEKNMLWFPWIIDFKSLLHWGWKYYT